MRRCKSSPGVQPGCGLRLACGDSGLNAAPCRSVNRPWPPGASSGAALEVRELERPSASGRLPGWIDAGSRNGRTGIAHRVRATRSCQTPRAAGATAARGVWRGAGYAGAAEPVFEGSSSRDSHSAMSSFGQELSFTSDRSGATGCHWQVTSPVALIDGFSARPWPARRVASGSFQVCVPTCLSRGWTGNGGKEPDQ